MIIRAKGFLSRETHKFSFPTSLRFRPARRLNFMSRICEICGKGAQTGYAVSHAQNRTKKAFKPNIRKVRLDIDGTVKKVKICAQCLKSTRVVEKEA